MPNEDDFLHIEGLKTKRIPKHERKFFGRQEKVDQKGIAGRGAASFGGWHLKYMKVKITYEGGSKSSAPLCQRKPWWTPCATSSINLVCLFRSAYMKISCISQTVDACRKTERLKTWWACFQPIQFQHRPCVLSGGGLKAGNVALRKSALPEKDGVPQPEYTINPGDIMIKFTAPEDRVIHSVTGRVAEKVTDTLDETSCKYWVFLQLIQLTQRLFLPKTYLWAGKPFHWDWKCSKRMASLSVLVLTTKDIGNYLNKAKYPRSRLTQVVLWGHCWLLRVQLMQDDFFCLAVDAVYPTHPLYLIGGFQCLGCTFLAHHGSLDEYPADFCRQHWSLQNGDRAFPWAIGCCK